MFRGDIVKGDSGAYAVFTEQGSTAAKVMDIIARLPDCDGQAADAVSAHTQVKFEDAPRLVKIPRSDKSWANIEDLVVLLERNLYGHPLAGLVWERQFEEVLLELGWEKVPNCECMFVHRKQKLFQSEYMGDIKMAGTKQNMAPIWKKLMKDIDLDEPTSSLDHVYFGCTQRECKPNETIVERSFAQSVKI